MVRRSAMSQVAGLLVTLGLLGATVPAVSDIRFENVTERAGINGQGQTYGASWGDLNADGWPDIWVSNHTQRPSLYLNQRDGTFRNAIDEVWSADPGDDTHGAAWSDFDNDGDQDLVETVGAIITEDDICFGCGENHFFVNEAGVLQDKATELGLHRPVGLSRTPMWFDADRDGRVDLLVVNQLLKGKAPSTLYRQTEGGFQVSNDTFGLKDAAVLSRSDRLKGLIGNLMHLRFGFPGRIHASPIHRFAQLADLTGDGELDLILYSRFTRVYAVDAVPFEEVTSDLGFPPGLKGVIDVAVADFDGDGDMDMYLTQGPYSASDVIQTSPSEIRGTVKGAQGPKGKRKPKGVAFGSDAEATFSIVYPPWLSASEIFIGPAGRHPETRSFTLSPDDPDLAGPVSPGAGLAGGIGIEYHRGSHKWTFLNYSGVYVDFFISAARPAEQMELIGFEPFKEQGVDTLLIRDQGRFIVRSQRGEAGGPTACHSVAAGDFDNDMDMDLYLVCSRSATNLPNRLLENDGKGNFTVVPGAGGAGGSDLGRGDVAVTADYDRDGFLDIFVTNGSDPASPLVDEGPHELFHNRGNVNHWLEIDLIGVRSNRDGIGATLELEAGGVRQVRGQGGGMHKFAQNHSRVHFGLGAHTRVDRLTIRWPSGAIQHLEDIPADQALRVEECRRGVCDQRESGN